MLESIKLALNPVEIRVQTRGGSASYPSIKEVSVVIEGSEVLQWAIQQVLDLTGKLRDFQNHTRLNATGHSVAPLRFLNNPHKASVVRNPEVFLTVHNRRFRIGKTIVLVLQVRTLTIAKIGDRDKVD